MKKLLLSLFTLSLIVACDKGDDNIAIDEIALELPSEVKAIWDGVVSELTSGKNSELNVSSSKIIIAQDTNEYLFKTTSFPYSIYYLQEDGSILQRRGNGGEIRVEKGVPFNVAEHVGRNLYEYGNSFNWLIVNEGCSTVEPVEGDEITEERLYFNNAGVQYFLIQMKHNISTRQISVYRAYQGINLGTSHFSGAVPSGYDSCVNILDGLTGPLPRTELTLEDGKAVVRNLYRFESNDGDADFTGVSFSLSGNTASSTTISLNPDYTDEILVNSFQEETTEEITITLTKDGFSKSFDVPFLTVEKFIHVFPPGSVSKESSSARDDGGLVYFQRS